MNPSPDPSNKDHPAHRLRSILHAEKTEVPLPVENAEVNRDILERLPRAKKPPSSEAAQSQQVQSGGSSQEAQPSVVARPRSKSLFRLTFPRPARDRLLPALWTVASILSLLVNAVLIGVIVTLLFWFRSLNLPLRDPVQLARLPVATVRGLYRNFEAMDQAHIVTQIPVSTSVPVRLEVCIRSGTVVVTNQDVIIPNARVTVQTGGLNITNASTRIILPANVQLPVDLDLCVPVETTIPVSLTVDVDIPLAETDLHQPFTGLQEVLDPVYCLLDPQAVDSNGISICEKAKMP